MQWVIKFLKKRLNQEQEIAAFHGSIAGAGRKYAESARMARERIPQLTDAIEILTRSDPFSKDPRMLSRSEKGRQLKRMVPEDRPSRQLEMFI